MIRQHLELLRAVVECDSQKMTELLTADPTLAKALISLDSKTALHVAVTGSTMIAVNILVNHMSPTDLEGALDNNKGTALHDAASAGNIQAAKSLLTKNSRLSSIADQDGRVPLHCAAQCGHKDMVKYLLDDDTETINILRGDDGDIGCQILQLLLLDGFYDLAVIVVDQFPNTKFKDRGCNIPIMSLAQQQTKVALFHAWSSKVQDIIIGKLNKSEVLKWLYDRIQPAYLRTVSNAHLKRKNSLKLVKFLCQKSEDLHVTEHNKIFSDAVHMAIKHGNCDFVREIIKTFPYAIWFRSDELNAYSTLEAAVVYRQDNVFNLLCKMSKCNIPKLAPQNLEERRDNILHLAAKLAPPDRLNIVSGPVLQMQRELQWFKEVESKVQPVLKNDLNGEGQTPTMVFNDEHKELVKEGEQWIKGIANYCTVVAALVATVTFAAQITLPGGNNNDSGRPLFLGHDHKTMFLLFAVLNATSLVSSIASVGVFLSIITAHCAPSDFLFELPSKLVIGLLTLLLSLTCMLTAFTVIFFLVLSLHQVGSVIFICVIVFPVALMGLVFSNFSHLKDTIFCTFGFGISHANCTLVDLRRLVLKFLNRCVLRNFSAYLIVLIWIHITIALN